MATEKRLIDANAFKMFLENVRQDYLEEDSFSSDFAARVIETVQDEYIANAPTVDAVEVVHGRWIGEVGGYMWRQNCSVCNDPVYNKMKPYYNYCPYCGAKMDGDGNGC